MAELLYKDEVYAVIGAAMEVHNTLGSGFLEAIYQEALEIELAERQVPFTAPQELAVTYKGKVLKKYYLADFVVYGKIIVEIKSLDSLSSHEEAQLLNYLKATGYEVGVLINFGADQLQWKRKILTKRSSTNNSFKSFA